LVLLYYFILNAVVLSVVLWGDGLQYTAGPC